MSAWTPEDTISLAKHYAVIKDLEILAARYNKSELQILRKLVSMKIYVKKQAPIVAMNKDMLARRICRLLGIQLLTMSNMSREDLNNFLEFLEGEE